MTNLRRRSEKIGCDPNQMAAILFALAIPCSYFINLTLYYVGLCFEENAVRSALFILGNCIFAVVCGVFFLFSVWKKRFSISALILLALTLAFFAGCFITAFLRAGMTKPLLENGQQFIAIGIPALLAGACGAAWQGEKKIFALLEQAAFFLVPACLTYLNGLIFRCSPFEKGAYLGIMNYMVFAYAIMPVFMALCIRFAQRAPLHIPFSPHLLRHSQWVRGVLITLLWLALLATGCRGPIICAAIFCVLLVGYQWLMKTKPVATTLLCAALLAFFLINLAGVAIPGMHRLSRMDVFLDGLEEGKISTTDEENLTDEQIQALISGGGQGGEAISEEDLVKMQNRGTLFKLAVAEWETSPIIGIGPLQYQNKYTYYPHSALLELLCETGIVGTAAVLVLLGLAGIGMLRRKEDGWIMIVFLLPYGVAANISGSVWSCVPLLFALGYGLSLKKRKVCPAKKETA